MRVFCDANVLFSASNAGSAFARLLALASERAELVTSELAVAEARRNLILKRPAWQGPFEDLLPHLEIVASAVFALDVELAAKDQPLLCAAIHAACDFFVTGDRRDFGHLFETTVKGVTVITPLRLGQLVVEAAEEQP